MKHTRDHTNHPHRGYHILYYGLVLTGLCVSAAAQTYTTLIPAGATWNYRKGTAEASDPRTAWREVDFNDGGWSAGAAPIGYGSGTNEVCSTVLSDMQGNYTCFFLRKTFAISSVDEDTRLRIRADYDDGFIVWINGERVLDKAEPDGTPLHDSTASEGHESGVFEEYVIGEDPDEYVDVGEPNVVAVQVFNADPGSSDCKFDMELTVFQRVADTRFSHDRGFYDAPFVCTITSDTTGATITYTLNGSDPKRASDTVTATAPALVTIDPAGGSHRLVNGAKAPGVVLRAYAHKSDYRPTDTDTQTYIFPSNVPQQPNLMVGEDWGGGETIYPGQQEAGKNTEMDPTIVSRYGATQVRNALLTLPTLSIVADYDDIFGNADGIYHWPNSEERGDLWERTASVELIYPDGYKGESFDGFQEDCGLRIQGGGSRMEHQPKRSFSLRFRGIYGATKLRYPFFEDAPNNKGTAVEKFDVITVRAGNNRGWNSRQPDKRAPTLYVRDQWVRDSQYACADVGNHGTFMHLYVNGMYWGMYNPSERADDSFRAEYFGGEKEDHFALNQGGSYVDLAMYPTADDRWNHMRTYAANNNLAISSNYDHIKEYLDIEKFCDYIIVQNFAGVGDWPGNNWTAGNQNVPPGPVSYFCWDGEDCFDFIDGRCHDGAWINPGLLGGGGNIGPLWRKLIANMDFRMSYADRIYKHCRNDGVLTEPASRERFANLFNHVKGAMVAESARWGDCKNDGTTYNPADHWYPETNRVLNMLPPNCDEMINVYRAYPGQKMYTDINPPEFAPQPGAIGAGFALTLTNPNGTVGTLVYKTDGSDPRTWDSTGNKASGALDYSSPIPMSKTTYVAARVRKTNGTWSPVHEATFNYTAHYPTIRISEIHYNPLGGSDFEFIEIRNTSSSPRGLSEMTFSKGIRYTFAPGAELAANQIIVLARNAAAFEQRYGFAPFAQYAGGLDNGGERVRLVDTDGTTVSEIKYNDKDPWPEETDGDGFSLVYTGTDGIDQDGPELWRASNLIGGSPGYDEGPAYRVVINEALTHTDLPQVDAIELHNVGDTAVSIGGWWLSDSDNDLFKYQLPSYSLGAGAYTTYDESDFGAAFLLSSHGDEIYLTHWDASSNLLYYAEARFGGAENGRAFGRHVTSDGDEEFVAQSVPDTLGGANAYPLVGPVVINELMYHPPDGGDEYIELKNISDAAVPLYNGTNTWRLDGAVEYSFPQGVTLDPGALILVVASNSTAGFRAKYGVPAGIDIYAPYTGALNNGGESVKLWRPDTPDTNGVPWILVDRVKYNDNSPWPESPDGDGPSLERIAPTLYGNDPANWAASGPSNGTPGEANSGVLVAKTAGWRYHDKGEDLGTGWRAPDYDDRAWDDGNAPLGYPDTNPEIDTETDWGDDPSGKYTTTYFRTAFTLDDAPSTLSSLTLRIKYDDGYVAWLNGTAVAWAGLTPSTVTHQTHASTTGSGGSYETVDITAHKTALVYGPGQLNVLAVEVHQTGPGSSDIFMDLDLSCQRSLPAEPLIAVSSSSISVSCEQGQDAADATFQVWNSGSDTLAYDVVESSSLFSVLPTGGSSTGTAQKQTHTVSFSTAGLTPGTYDRTISVEDNGSGAGNGPVTIDVHIEVTEPLPLFFTAYNDLHWVSGQLAGNITTYATTNGNGTATPSGRLMDYASGEPTDVVLTVTGGNRLASHATQGANAAAGTDADGVFGGILDCTGLTGSGGSPAITLRFTGLATDVRYELVVYGDRDNPDYTDRLTTVTIAGVGGFENRSSAGADFSGPTDSSVTICHGYNNTNGFVARFEEIVPQSGTDMVVTIDSPTGKYYVNALMLRGYEPGNAPVPVEKGATWRYRKGTTEASDPGAAWRRPDFDDGGWASGAAPFGYGDGPYGTDLTGMKDSYSCVFLRKTFTVESPARVSAIDLWALYDDGFVMWLNGKEVARHNVAGAAGTTPAFDGTATNSVADGTEWTKTLSGSTLPMLAGTNLLAVQVFNVGLSSSDLTMDVELSLVISHLPLAEDADQDGMPDDWEGVWLSDLSDPSDLSDTADPDQDGVSNIGEWIAGTDPDDETGYLKLETRVNGGQLVVAFMTTVATGTGYAGLTRHYGLQKRSDPTAPWTDVPGYADITATGGEVVYTESSATPAHYRLKVWLE